MKKEFANTVWEHTKTQLDKRKLSQVEILRLCNEQGFVISQSELSRLMNNNTKNQPKMTLYQAVAFSKVLKISLDELVTGNPVDTLVNVSGNAFVCDPESYAFQGYLGSFNIYFPSTDMHEPQKILKGKVLFEKSQSGKGCHAVLTLDTEQKNASGKNVLKVYEGDLIMSPNLGACYLLLTNNRIGEMNLILFRYRGFLVKQMECRLGLALTISAGEVKAPIVHRILLSRQEISASLLHEITPFMFLAENSFLVEESCLEDVVKEYPSLNDIINKIKSFNSPGKYYLLDETIIRSARKKISQMEMAEIVSILLNTAEIPHSSRLTEWSDNKAFDLIRKSELSGFD